ncbi:MAG: DUF4870 domain-containing protein [Archaeoglobaceae archaeon]|nr:DUF4870 domain-containing protein [Archaeoglobaceae archaeon]MDW8128721.1 DUF4870 domain-containing protein [Archaeoglobaceae archaeon]
MNGEAKPAEAQKPKTSIGLEENVAGLLCYLGFFITGIVFLLIEKENKFVRFHAMQSTVTFLSLIVLVWILSILGVFIWILWPLIFLVNILIIIIIILWLVGMIKAYQGEMYKFPIFGDIAESMLK